MENSDESVHSTNNPNWPYIPDYPHRILIIGGSRTDKMNVLLNLIKYQQLDIGRIYFCVRDPFELKYQFLFNGREKVGIEQLKNPKPFIDYSQTIDNVHKNLGDFNPAKNRNVLMIADIEANKKLSFMVTELFIRARKVNISLFSILQSYSIVSKDIRPNATHFIMNLPNKKELQQIVLNHSSDLEFQDWSFTKIIKKKRF